MSVQVNTQIARSADREYLIRRSMSKGYHRRRMGALPWSINRMLRATWIGGAVGIAQGGALEYLRTMNERDDALRTRRIDTIYDMDFLRAEDHSTIGAMLGATLTPALFWKRARGIHLFLGGAGVGAGIGLLVHWIRNFTEEPLPQLTPPQHTEHE